VTNMPMTLQEVRSAMKGLISPLRRYADLLVADGAAIQPGQELVVNAPAEAVDFTRMVVRAAYERGAGHVTVIWNDDQVARLEYENCPVEHFDTTPSWRVEQLNSLAEAGAAFLYLEGEDPCALAGIDPAKPACARRARNRDCHVFRHGMDFGINAWSIGGVSTKAWAKTVFPEYSEDEAVYRLWLAILDVARATGIDPHSTWETHNATFEKNKRLLNEGRFDHLRYRSSNGTDLTVGMTKGHVWEGGAARTVGGVSFFPNIPTEEVFTSPDRMRADGVVHSALPLVHAGRVVRDFWFRFEGGAVVDFDAAEGRDVLEQIVATDENACRLGEVALVSKNTPIRQSGLLFYSTLYDENASCHLALGTGFPECLEGGEEMSVEELLAHGVNHSHTHVDFMVGSDDLDVTGVREDGTEVPIFVSGQWAWE